MTDPSTICAHPTTFLCHGTQRCEACYLDQLTLHDGSTIWPSQDHPDDWTPDRIANWFLDNKIHWLPQGDSGFQFCRNNHPTSSGESRSLATYGYVWVEATLDLDYYAAWLLDVRKTSDDPDVSETRQFIYITSEFCDPPVVYEHDWRYSTDGISRLTNALHWMADITELWLTNKRNA